MQQAINLEHLEWRLGSVQTQLSLIHVETLQTQCKVLCEHFSVKKELEAAHEAFDKKARAAKSEIKKQIKAVGKVELCEELLSAVEEDSETAKYLKKKIARICLRRAKK
jgi:hypothetical protein